MKFKHLVLILLSVTLFFSLAIPVKAQESQPGIAEPPPSPPDNFNAPLLSSDPDTFAAENPDPALLQAAGLPPLKAVLVVGPIDPQNGNVATQREIANMEQAAASLQYYGVQVIRLYPPNDTWANLKAAAQNANFLMYRGHGLYWGSPWPTPSVGGFSLSERLFTNDDIKRDLKLAPNAIVMLYACLATGSSTTDQGSISQAEARRRVSQYAQPFVELGAAGYYANWFGDSFKVYVDNLFSGMTLGDAFKNYQDYQPSLAATTTHLTYPSVPLILSWDNWDPYSIPKPQYNNAFVGQASNTLWDLFQPTLQLSANSIAYIAKPSSPARTYQISIQSSNASTISWTAAPASGSTPNWVSFTPTTGKSGTVLKITLTPPASAGKFQTSLAVSGANGTGTQTVSITLVTTANPRKVFLPRVVR